MNRALEEAERMRRALGVVGVATTADIERAAEAAGLEVVDTPMSGTLYGARMQIEHRGRLVSVALLRSGMGRGERAFVLAHELGHHVLGHEGNHLYSVASWRDMRGPYRNRDEHSATLFGGCFLAGLPLGPSWDERLKEAEATGIPAAALLLYVEAAGPVIRAEPGFFRPWG